MDSAAGATTMTTNKCGEGRLDKKRRVSVSRCCSALSSRDLLIQNYSNFKCTSEPIRFMFYERGSWIDYPTLLVEVMKTGFSEGRPMIETQVEEIDRLFDFYRMVEIELECGDQRSISWIDANGKCFFPKVFIDGYEKDEDVDEDCHFADCVENYPKIDIEIEIRENSGSSEDLKVVERSKTGILSKRKREHNAEKMEAEESFSPSNVKRRQINGEHESQSARWPKTRILGIKERGYTIVKNLFMSGLGTVEPGAEVTVINQFVRTDPLDKARYQVFMTQMEAVKQVRGDSNMVFAWHGTSSKGVESIFEHGFGLPHMLSNSPGYGSGIQLSSIRSPQDSAMFSEIDENGEKHVILCRVILGKCEKVDAGCQQSCPSCVEYDTGVDDMTNPKWYTVWHANMNTHILPECIVSYKPVNAPGAVSGKHNLIQVPHPSLFIAKLFGKLRSYLPMPKLQELQSLCGSYKEGKLGKNVFMRQLRSVVGDDVLRSTIHEIRG